MGCGWIINRILNPVETNPPPVFISELVLVPSVGGAFTTLDAIGVPFKFLVPISGVIQSATLIDRDYEGTEIDIPLFREPFVAAASADAYTISDTDIKNLIKTLKFTVFDDHVQCYESSVENIGKLYKVRPKSRGSKWGWMYSQAKCLGTPTIAAGSEYLLRIEILSDKHL